MMCTYVLLEVHLREWKVGDIAFLVTKLLVQQFTYPGFVWRKMTLTIALLQVTDLPDRKVTTVLHIPTPLD